MVIGRVLNTLPEEEGAEERVAARIEWLVSQGRLEAQGNLELWRHSEVRAMS